MDSGGSDGHHGHPDTSWPPFVFFLVDSMEKSTAGNDISMRRFPDTSLI